MSKVITFIQICLLAICSQSFAADKPLNILLFTADDLHAMSLGSFGGQVSDLTPELDKFASEGMRFYKAHVNAAICAPSRAILATGLYSHNSGAMGFMPSKPDIPTVNDIFKNAGYMMGILGKVSHSTPKPGTKWDYAFDQKELGDGRSPQIYYERSVEFFKQCKTANKPFYFMVNSHDPHRPFQYPGKLSKGAEAPSKYYDPKEVEVPGFIPDLPGVREELSAYQNSTRRLDDTFGRVMEALKEAGHYDNTIVMFLADNGIAIPFAKCNTYLASTRTPWIVRWPGQVKAGSLDETHYISGVDFLPTILEATGVKAPAKMDGRSFLPLLKGQSQTGRDFVFTQIDSKAGGASTPMRCVQDGRFGYIFNGFADGKFWYRNNNEGGTMRAMEEAAKNDPEVAARVKLFRHRVLEELFDLEKDPNGLNNLIDHPEYQEVKARLITKLNSWMVETNDPVLKAFQNRHDEAKRKAALKDVYGEPKDESPAARAAKKKQSDKAKKKKKKDKA